MQIVTYKWPCDPNILDSEEISIHLEHPLEVSIFGSVRCVE